MPGSASDSRTRATLPGCFIGSWESLPRGFKRTSVTPKPAIRSVACLAIKRAWRVEWCRLRDSNPRPPDYKSGALPAELSRQPVAVFQLSAFHSMPRKAPSTLWNRAGTTANNFGPVARLRHLPHMERLRPDEGCWPVSFTNDCRDKIFGVAPYVWPP